MKQYTLTIIRGSNTITKQTFNSKEQAENLYYSYFTVLNVQGVYGLQLWQHQQGKTIDNDRHARIIKQYNI